MPRPVPNSKFLTLMALKIQRRFRSGLPGASLLAASPSSNFAVLVGSDNQEFHVLDRSAGRILHAIELPSRARQASDFVRFAFSPSGNFVAAYNVRDSSFAVWSLNEGKLLCQIDGEGQFPGKMVFLDDAHVVMADSPRLVTNTVFGQTRTVTRLPEETRDVALHCAPGAPPQLTAVGILRRKNLGGHIHCYKIRNGMIESQSEGPYRERAQAPMEKRTVYLNELYNIPGQTDRSLIICDEEVQRFEPRTDDGIPEERYTTRLNALDPSKAIFYEDELTIPGRHCLEFHGEQLRLIDEMGRHRRVECFPLRLELSDWRLEGAMGV